MSASVPARRVLVSVWAVLAVALGASLAVARAADGPLDDPDPAHQRPGILDGFGLPQPAGPITPGIPGNGRRTVVFFERAAGVRALCDALADSELAGAAVLAVVVSGPAGAGADCGPVTVVDDPRGRRAAAYGLRRPVDGGTPVGYAVVDRDGQVRYRTLDPSVADELDEVGTIVDATS